MTGATTLNILIRVIGILGITMSVIGFQCKSHRAVIGFRTADELFFALQYLLLGGYTGAISNGISTVRNILFIEQVKRGKSTHLWRAVFALVFIAVAAFTYNGIPSLIFAVGKVITTYVYGSKNMRFVRIMTLVTSVMWIIYNFTIRAYEAIVSDTLTIVSVAIAIIRLDILAAKKPNGEAHR